MGVANIPTAYDARVRGGTWAGPGSYATGGSSFDPGGFAYLTFLDMHLVTRGTLTTVQTTITLNNPSNGQALIVIKKERYDKAAAATGSAQNTPAGVSVQTSSGQTVGNESAHTHNADHNHAQVTSGLPQSGTAGILTTTGLGDPNLSTHTHTVDLPLFSLTSGAGAAHNHAYNILYSHVHAVTNTQTDITMVEVANATDLSASTFRWIAVGR